MLMEFLLNKFKSRIIMNGIKKIAIPKKSLKYILFQRTGYLRNNFIFKLLSKLGEFEFFYKATVIIKCWLFSLQIKKSFGEDMIREYSTIKPYLPQRLSSVLDIGSGVAAIDALISDHYGNNVDVFLIDKTMVDKNVYYKLEKRGSFYNSLSVAKELLDLNGVKSVHLQEATDDNRINFNYEFDLIISLISWGFHYPIETYLSQAYQKLKSNGILIVDVRKNTLGENEIKKQFGNIQIIFESNKFIRVLASKA